MKRSLLLFGLFLIGLIVYSFSGESKTVSYYKGYCDKQNGRKPASVRAQACECEAKKLEKACGKVECSTENGLFQFSLTKLTRELDSDMKNCWTVKKE